MKIGRPRKVDFERVLEVYAETGSKRETVKRTGVSRTQVRYIIRTSQGICPRCSEPAVEDHVYCAEHRVAELEKSKRVYHNRKQRGICVFCQEPASGGTVFCEFHRRHRADLTRTRRHQLTEQGLCANCGKKPLAPTSKWFCSECLAHANARQTYLTEIKRYGGPRSEVMEQLGNRCIVCGREDGLHIHHLDGQGHLSEFPNNDPDNLVLLCPHHHAAVTTLINHASAEVIQSLFGKVLSGHA